MNYFCSSSIKSYHQIEFYANIFFFLCISSIILCKSFFFPAFVHFRFHFLLCIEYLIFLTEFFHTEKSHVRTLKVLDRLFFRPLIENSFMSRELVDQLFPNLEEVLAQHNQYNQKMKERAKAGFPVGNIGDMLCEMVRFYFFAKVQKM